MPRNNSQAVAVCNAVATHPAVAEAWRRHLQARAAWIEDRIRIRESTIPTETADSAALRRAVEVTRLQYDLAVVRAEIETLPLPPHGDGPEEAGPNQVPPGDDSVGASGSDSAELMSVSEFARRLGVRPKTARRVASEQGLVVRAGDCDKVVRRRAEAWLSDGASRTCVEAEGVGRRVRRPATIDSPFKSKPGRID